MTAVTDPRSDESTGSTARDDAPVRQPLEAVLLTPGVIDAVRSLVEIMDRGGVTKLDLVHGDLSISLRGGDRSPGHHEAGGVAPANTELKATPAVAVEVAPVAIDPGDFVVTSPMVGTYYSAPSPGSPPFVQVGDAVEAGQTVGIVEAMKIMNEIVAERGGVVTALLVESGQAVEYGSPLIRLGSRPALSVLA
jgi:acetyl-CoA carboxylase biotin carboxyl carrier protein